MPQIASQLTTETAMALGHRFMSLAPLSAYGSDAWGWSDVLDALDNTDRVLARKPSSLCMGQQPTAEAWRHCTVYGRM